MSIRHTIASRHLAGNLLGDPAERDVYVCLPPSYETSTRRYPVAYLLHGFAQTAASLVAPGDGRGREQDGPPIEHVLQLAHAGSARELILVVVDGSTRYGGSQWVSSPVSGCVEEYVTREVVGFIDKRYRTIPLAASRAVFGHSSGGFGAYHLGSLHPEVFGVIGMLSADSYFEHHAKPILYRYYESLYENGADAGECPDGPIPGNVWSQLSYCYAAAYSPNPAAPHFVELPIAFPSGAVLEEVWVRWLGFDPVINSRARLDALASLRGLLLDVGRHDEFGLLWGHRLLRENLENAGIPHTYREHGGTHGAPLGYRHLLALGWLLSVLASSDD